MLLASTPTIELVPPAVSAAPPSQPPVRQEHAGGGRLSAQAATQVYSIGQPTDEEQLYVELLNRSRRFPAQEVEILINSPDASIQNNLNFFNTDRNLLIEQFRALTPVPPLALNPLLSQAARRHSVDMFNNVFQGHIGSDGSDIRIRIDATGYQWLAISENVYAAAETIISGHAGFDLDWGKSPTGIQTPPGHRNTIHAAEFREVGVSVILGRNSKGTNSVGPIVVSQEFANPVADKPLLSGVVYYDLDGDQFYDIGEGLGGVEITVAGVDVSAVSANSGGYTIPLPGNGTFQVTFSSPTFPARSAQVVVSGLKNVKLDQILAYSGPVPTGPARPFVGRPNTYTASLVPGATEYEWIRARLATPRVELASGNLTNLVFGTSPGYPPVTNHLSPTRDFHLAHLSTGATDQIIRLNSAYLLGSDAKVEFSSRLGWSTVDEQARVEVSVDDGLNWTQVYTQAGTSTASSQNAGELNFAPRSASLAAFAGKTVLIRFNFAWSAGIIFGTDQNGVGWYFNSIAVKNAQQVAPIDSVRTATQAMQFSPPDESEFMLQVRPLAGSRVFPFGSPVKVAAAPAPAEIRMAMPARAGAALDLEFTLGLGTPPASFKLESATSPAGPWAEVAGATAVPRGAGRFAFVIATPTQAQFFRVRGN